MDARRSGRPSTSRSEENMALVRDMLTRSPRKSTRQAASESGLSRHTVRTVLKKDLNFRPRKPQYMQELTPEDCDRRMEYGELMLGWHEDWPKLFENILWSNEAVFHIGSLRHTIPKWRWRRCKIVQKWLCGVEWRPRGSSVHILCVIVIVIYSAFHKIHSDIETVQRKKNTCITFVQ